MHQLGHLLFRKIQIGLRACLVRGARERQIRDGRQCNRRSKDRLGGHRFGSDVCSQYERQISSCGISRNGNPAYSAIVQPAVCRQHVINCGRKWMLGS
jgi:hypothetical protein